MTNIDLVIFDERSGTVFTYKEGTVKIRAKAQDGSGVVGEATLTVKPPVMATSITVCPSSVTVNVGSSTQLNAEVYSYRQHSAEFAPIWEIGLTSQFLYDTIIA